VKFDYSEKIDAAAVAADDDDDAIEYNIEYENMK
jgi:hypothetical protein